MTDTPSPTGPHTACPTTVLCDVGRRADAAAAVLWPDDDDYRAALALTEEAGEVARATIKHGHAVRDGLCKGQGPDWWMEQKAAELAQVVLVAARIAYADGIDLAGALADEVAALEDRAAALDPPPAWKVKTLRVDRLADLPVCSMFNCPDGFAKNPRNRWADANKHVHLPISRTPIYVDGVGSPSAEGLAALLDEKLAAADVTGPAERTARHRVFSRHADEMRREVEAYADAHGLVAGPGYELSGEWDAHGRLVNVLALPVAGFPVARAACLAAASDPSIGGDPTPAGASDDYTAGWYDEAGEFEVSDVVTGDGQTFAEHVFDDMAKHPIPAVDAAHVAPRGWGKAAPPPDVDLGDGHPIDEPWHGQLTSDKGAPTPFGGPPLPKQVVAMLVAGVSNFARWVGR